MQVPFNRLNTPEIKKARGGGTGPNQDQKHAKKEVRKQDEMRAAHRNEEGREWRSKAAARTAAMRKWKGGNLRTRQGGSRKNIGRGYPCITSVANQRGSGKPSVTALRREARLTMNR